MLLAQALARETSLFLADEPIAAFRARAAEGRGILLAIRGLGLAARACDRLILIRAGCVVAEGPVLAPVALR